MLMVWPDAPVTEIDPGKPVAPVSDAQVDTSVVIEPAWTLPLWPLQVVESAPFISMVSAVAPVSPAVVLKTKRILVA